MKRLTLHCSVLWRLINVNYSLLTRNCNFCYRARGEEGQLIKSRPCHDFVYRNCFTGCELVDWLIQNAEVADRGQGVLLGRELLKQGIIKHGMSECLKTICGFPIGI